MPGTVSLVWISILINACIEVIRLIFARFREIGSARQVFLALRAAKIHFPRPSDGRTLVSFDWTLIRYRNVISILKNPSMRECMCTARARSER
jgi:hypothetical protein